MIAQKNNGWMYIFRARPKEVTKSIQCDVEYLLNAETLRNSGKWMFKIFKKGLVWIKFNEIRFPLPSNVLDIPFKLLRYLQS